MMNVQFLLMVVGRRMATPHLMAITAISIESGKSLDVEPMSRYCKESETQ